MGTTSQQLAPVDTDGWLTCTDAANKLGISQNTIRNWERRGKLHPQKAPRPHPLGAFRDVLVYDPAELARMPRRRIASTIHDPGELCARAFELFDAGSSLREVVIKLREQPTKVEELHDQWVNFGGADIVVGPIAHAEIERYLGAFVGVAGLVERLREALPVRVVDDARDDASGAEAELVGASAP